MKFINFVCTIWLLFGLLADCVANGSANNSLANCINPSHSASCQNGRSCTATGIGLNYTCTYTQMFSGMNFSIQPTSSSSLQLTSFSSLQLTSSSSVQPTSSSVITVHGSSSSLNIVQYIRFSIKSNLSDHHTTLQIVNSVLQNITLQNYAIKCLNLSRRAVDKANELRIECTVTVNQTNSQNQSTSVQNFVDRIINEVRANSINSTQVIISEFGFCDFNTTNERARGVFQWNETKVNTTVIASCMYGPDHVIGTRRCVSRNTWATPSVNQCDVENFSTDSNTQMPYGFKLTLEITTYVCTSLSLLGLLFVILTHIIFRHFRKRDSAKFHVQLALSMMFMSAVFMAGINRTENRTGCIIVGVLLHYFVLVAWMWIGAEALLLFQKLFIKPNEVGMVYIAVVSVNCWGFPLVPVAVSVGIDFNNYITVLNTTFGSGFCFTTNIGVYYGAFVGPLYIIVIFNTVVFVASCILFTKNKICNKHGTTSKVQQKKKISSKEACKLIVTLAGMMTLLMVSWRIVLFTQVVESSNVAASFAVQWLFLFFVSLQGFFLFIFFFVFSHSGRNAWFHLLCCCFKTKGQYSVSTNQLQKSAGMSRLKDEDTIKGIMYKDGSHNTDPIDKSHSDTADEKPQPDSESGGSSPPVSFMVKLHRASTKRKKHHIETAVMDFNGDNEEETLF